MPTRVMGIVMGLLALAIGALIATPFMVSKLGSWGGLISVTLVFSILVLIFVTICILVLPKWLVRQDVTQASFQRLGSSDRLKAIHDVRTALLQGVQVLGVVAVLVGALLTFQQGQEAEIQALQSQSLLQLDRQSRVQDQLSKAFEQLGDEKLTVRLGAIYLLRETMQERKYERAISEFLVAFVRQRSPWPPITGSRNRVSQAVTPLHVRSPDVQAILEVLSQSRVSVGPMYRLQLNELDLRNSRLAGFYFESASFRGTHLDGSDLSGARLQEAVLQESSLNQVDLTGADIRRADLRHADLRGAQLRNASLEGADMRGSIADKRTSWPTGFNPSIAGVVLK